MVWSSRIYSDFCVVRWQQSADHELNSWLNRLRFWFLLAFVLRWTLGVVARPDLGNAQDRASSQVDGVGGNLDLTTPDENENLNELLKPKPEQTDEGNNGFAPLNPPKLVSNKDPEELAKAVRHLTDK